MTQPSYEQRRDERFHGTTIAVLKDIEDRALQLPQEQRYAAAYGILRGYVESLLTNFAEAFSAEQLAEIRIVLDQLSKVAGEDSYIDEVTRDRLDQLARQLRESKDLQSQQAPGFDAEDLAERTHEDWANEE